MKIAAADVGSQFGGIVILGAPASKSRRPKREGSWVWAMLLGWWLVLPPVSRMSQSAGSVVRRVCAMLDVLDV